MDRTSCGVAAHHAFAGRSMAIQPGNFPIPVAFGRTCPLGAVGPDTPLDRGGTCDRQPGPPQPEDSVSAAYLRWQQRAHGSVLPGRICTATSLGFDHRPPHDHRRTGRAGFDHGVRRKRRRPDLHLPLRCFGVRGSGRGSMRPWFVGCRAAGTAHRPCLRSCRLQSGDASRPVERVANGGVVVSFRSSYWVRLDHRRFRASGDPHFRACKAGAGGCRSCLDDRRHRHDGSRHHSEHDPQAQPRRLRDLGSGDRCVRSDDNLLPVAPLGRISAYLRPSFNEPCRHIVGCRLRPISHGFPYNAHTANVAGR